VIAKDKQKMREGSATLHQRGAAAQSRSQASLRGGCIERDFTRISLDSTMNANTD
jgi:hypothetical protein